ncbi:MAG: hypothetical protein KDC71_01900 [Acidobacteria bacterium]|nr:hypothetical protein [Acidobacteriota bacterium]
METKPDFLSLSDAIVVLVRRRGVFALVFILIMALAIAYATLSKKTYELTGTLQVGKFKGELLEDGEFVAQKFEDYSFIKAALQEANIPLDISVSRMQKLIKTEVVNEVKKTKDVGLVQLNVKYKDQQKVRDIFQALTDKMIRDHQHLLDISVAVLKDEEAKYEELSQKMAESIAQDEELSRKNALDSGQKTVPSLLLLEHTISEKRTFRSLLTKNIHEVRVDAEAATSSFNSRLAAAPEMPDAHMKPKLTLTVMLGFIAALILATCSAFLWELLQSEVIPKLRKA